MVYGYLRVSTNEQENEKFKVDILMYSNKHDLGKVEFWEEKISGRKNWKERELGNLLINICKKGDLILIPEISRISRSISQIYEIITFCQNKDITLHFLKQNLVITQNPDMTTKVMLSTFSLISEMEREFISMRTKESLKSKKLQGVKLGRPKGSTGKSKLDPYKKEIHSFIKCGTTKVWLGKHYNVSPITVSNWLRKNPPIYN